jgi:hypothetical protein
VFLIRKREFDFDRGSLGKGCAGFDEESTPADRVGYTFIPAALIPRITDPNGKGCSRVFAFIYRGRSREIIQYLFEGSGSPVILLGVVEN